jgi:hypothetical protein
VTVTPGTSFPHSGSAPGTNWKPFADQLGEPLAVVHASGDVDAVIHVHGAAAVQPQGVPVVDLGQGVDQGGLGGVGAVAGRQEGDLQRNSGLAQTGNQGEASIGVDARIEGVDAGALHGQGDRPHVGAAEGEAAVDVADLEAHGLGRLGRGLADSDEDGEME